MKIANRYNHLNGEEFLICRRETLYQEIENAVASIDANAYTKVSRDRQRAGRTLYDQKRINAAFKEFLEARGWHEKKISYLVTDDIQTAKEISHIKEREEQRAIIQQRGSRPFNSNNQVDFVKDRVAVEVQFGKYFSVAYDLHVKHTFFFMRDEIDVGIEIIPTHNMMRHMDTGVSWFENEVANVIREGRNNPSVPIVILGIEPEEITI